MLSISEHSFFHKETIRIPIAPTVY